jgi:hypothetical protein
MRKQLLISLGAAAFFISSPALAKGLKWMDGPDGLPKGSKIAVVSGDPAKKGPFTIQLKFPADYAVPAHHHPSKEVVTVLFGKLHYGMSDKLDMATAKTLTAGHTVTMKAMMNHWVHAPAAATVQVRGTGPFQIVYVDPKDDPRGAGK